MDNKELALLGSWRFTKVRAGDKIPYPAKWETNHLPLYGIPQDDNIGVVLGEASNGLMALDFDGPTSWEWFSKNIDCDITNTVVWTSGKEGRCQMAYTIPEEYWPYIRTHKITTKAGDKNTGLKPEQMEFRWNGLQSVLPPSLHPEYKDGYNYNWISAPSTTKVAVLPDAIIVWLLNHSMPKKVVAIQQTDIFTIKDDAFLQLEKSIEKLKGFYPILDYDSWLRVMFAVAHDIGDAAAAILLNKYWPEQRQGEYMAHLRGRVPGRITPGTIIHMIRVYEPMYMKKLAGIDYQRSVKNRIKQLKEEIYGN